MQRKTAGKARTPPARLGAPGRAPRLSGVAAREVCSALRASPLALRVGEVHGHAAHLDGLTIATPIVPDKEDKCADNLDPREMGALLARANQ